MAENLGGGHLPSLPDAGYGPAHVYDVPVAATSSTYTENTMNM